MSAACTFFGDQPAWLVITGAAIGRVTYRDEVSTRPRARHSIEVATPDGSEIYPSIAAAARALGITAGSLRKRLEARDAWDGAGIIVRRLADA